ARGSHGAGDRAPALHDRDRRPHPRHAQGRAARGGDARGAAGARRHLRAPLPRAVRRPGAARRAGRGAAVKRRLLVCTVALLAASTWWYPVVGRVPYQGFFERGQAEAAGERLSGRGLDVEVRPAVAFSTLGWFADPLLSTVAQAPPVALADTVIHELFHSTIYVPGDATFNESAATFAGHRGAIAFFCSGPGAAPKPCAEARRRWAVTRARATLFARVAT